MKNGKYSKNNGAKAGLNKSLALVLVLVLVLSCVVGGTIAWFTDKTDDVVNTFTVGNIDITLEETWNTDADGDGTNDSWSAALIPGFTYTKDPKVTVEAGSEDCWVFVKVVEANPVGYITNADSTKTLKTSYTFGNFLTYSIAADWTPLTDANDDGIADDGVYYKKVESSTTDQTWSVLVNDQVFVKDTVTKGMMDDLQMFVTNDVTSDEYSPLPTLTFTAYAVQLYKTNNEKFTAAEAWNQVSTN